MAGKQEEYNPFALHFDSHQDLKNKLKAYEDAMKAYHKCIGNPGYFLSPQYAYYLKQQLCAENKSKMQLTQLAYDAAKHFSLLEQLRK